MQAGTMWECSVVMYNFRLPALIEINGASINILVWNYCCFMKNNIAFVGSRWIFASCKRQRQKIS